MPSSKQTNKQKNCILISKCAVVKFCFYRKAFALLSLSERSVSSVFDQDRQPLPLLSVTLASLSLCNCENLSSYKRVTRSWAQEHQKTSK